MRIKTHCWGREKQSAKGKNGCLSSGTCPNSFGMKTMFLDQGGSGVPRHCEKTVRRASVKQKRVGKKCYWDNLLK